MSNLQYSKTGWICFSKLEISKRLREEFFERIDAFGASIKSEPGKERHQKKIIVDRVSKSSNTFVLNWYDFMIPSRILPAKLPLQKFRSTFGKNIFALLESYHNHIFLET